MNKTGWNHVGPEHPATQKALSDSEAFRAAPCSPSSDTPETDAACEAVYAQGVAHIPLVGFMEKLERERDEARKDAEKARAYKRVLKNENARLRRMLNLLENTKDMPRNASA